MLAPLKQKEDNCVKSDDFDFLRTVVTGEMTKKLSALFKEGIVTAAPKTVNSQFPPCTYCNMQSICKNGAKNVETVAVSDWKKISSQYLEENDAEAEETAGSEEEKGEEE